LARKAFIFLASLEALSTAPLAIFLPLSGAALVLAVALITALNAPILATAGTRIQSAYLQMSNLAVCGLVIALAFGSPRLPWQASAATICALGVGQFVAGVSHLSAKMMQRCFAAKQFALASTAVFWILIRHFHLIHESGRTFSYGHLEMGLRFLFMGPLALVAVVFFAELAGWRGYFITLAGVCVGQWGMGFLELGEALEAFRLVIAGFVLLGVFLLLLAVAVVPRRSALRNS
jgi:hypothetical protein